MTHESPAVPPEPSAPVRPGLSPEASAEALAALAQSRPDLHADILVHPNIYPALREWIQNESGMRQPDLDPGQPTARPTRPAALKWVVGLVPVMVVVAGLMMHLFWFVEGWSYLFMGLFLPPVWLVVAVLLFQGIAPTRWVLTCLNVGAAVSLVVQLITTRYWVWAVVWDFRWYVDSWVYFACIITMGVLVAVTTVLVWRASVGAHMAEVREWRVNRRPQAGGVGVASASGPQLVGHTAAGEPVYANAVVSVQSTNTMAILALVFGVLGGVLAIPFGHVARSQIRRTGEGGAGLALAGLILGYVALAAWVVGVIVLLVLWSRL